jgi:hypothetical protein
MERFSLDGRESKTLVPKCPQDGQSIMNQLHLYNTFSVAYSVTFVKVNMVNI